MDVVSHLTIISAETNFSNAQKFLWIRINFVFIPGIQIFMGKNINKYLIFPNHVNIWGSEWFIAHSTLNILPLILFCLIVWQMFGPAVW